METPHNKNRTVFSKRPKMGKFYQYSKENFVGDPNEITDKPGFRGVNIHVHNGCNLACRGCNHNSQVLAPGSGVDVDQMISDCEKILPRIHVWGHISLVGGEPFLEPRWSEMLTRIEDLANCKIKFYSNGILLHKHMEKIVEHMRRGTILKLSMHVSPYSTKGKLIYKNVEDFIEYAKDKVNLENCLEISEQWEDKWFDMLKWEDGKFYPHEDNDLEKSWSFCTCPQMQIYRGHLWKCASIAYLKESLEATGQSDDEVWQKYLKYKPTPVDAPIEDIYKMSDTQWKKHSICNMCPANPKYFYANKQLEVRKQVVSQFDDPV